MAGGIDWFRWHHGSVTDPKFQLVAKRASVPLPSVLAVWAYLLEQASSSDMRGTFGSVDGEAIDLLFGFDDGTTGRIMGCMRDRGLIGADDVSKWSQRQVKRERTDDNSTARVQAFRERQSSKSDIDGVTGNETPRNATKRQNDDVQRQETPRGEESREEESTEANASVVASLPAADCLACPHQVITDAWAEILPELPAVRSWNATRAKHLQTRWREQAKAKGWKTSEDGVEWFRKLFGYVRKSAFLMGQSARGDGHEGWTCTLPWLIAAENFAKVIDGNYHREAA